MQQPSWYLNRLKSMSAAEVLWRVRSAGRDVVDRYRISHHRYPSASVFPGSDLQGAGLAGFHVTDLAPGAWMSAKAGEREGEWLDKLRKRADRLAAHRFDFFDLEQRFLGDPIDWHRDHGSGRPAPRTYSQSIDYRDFSVTGDCKLVWEPNRHHHLVVLGRAYRATGERRYAREISAQLESWLDANPFGMGMNWRSPLELGIRLINWVWALDLVRGAETIPEDLKRRVLQAAYLHCWDVSRKYSRGSSANNHLIGEAAGVYVGASYFQGMPHAERWRRESRAILTEEIRRQSYGDGCTREQALGYQLFVLHFFLVAGVVARKIGEDFPPEFWERVERVLEFLARLQEGGEHLPKFGDADDGYVLDLGGDSRESRQLLAVGAALFDRGDFKRLAGEDTEPVLWLLGSDGIAKLEAIESGGAPRLESRAFTDSGYYLLQSGVAGSPRSVSVLFDCGELGYGAIAAHGHADALAFTVRVGGEDLFVDPGTYDYFTYPEWRGYFRGTGAHNTVTIDGLDQSVMLGPFLWGARAHASCTRWEPRNDGGIVAGAHDGYARLANRVRHQRTLELNRSRGELNIDDEIATTGAHQVEIAFHLAETCRLEQVEGRRCTVSLGSGRRCSLLLDSALTVEVRAPTSTPPGGWVSRGYHRREASTTIVGRARITGSQRFSSVLQLGNPDDTSASLSTQSQLVAASKAGA